MPVVEKIPPTMPHSRTRNCHSGMCCSLTVTIRELVSYFTKMPETPWLPAAWFITRSWGNKQPVSLLTVRTDTHTRTAHKFNFSHPLCHRELVGVGGYLVCVQFGGYHGDEVLEHLVICSQKKVGKKITILKREVGDNFLFSCNLSRPEHRSCRVGWRQLVIQLMSHWFYRKLRKLLH